MGWSYIPDLQNPLYQLRSLIGDTDASDVQLQDEELVALLPGGPLACGSIYLAGAAACRRIAARYTRQVTTSVGTLKVLLDQRQKAYLALAKELGRENVRSGGVMPFAGGVSIDTTQTEEQDDNRIQPAFVVTMGDNEGGLSGTPSTDGWGYPR